MSSKNREHKEVNQSQIREKFNEQKSLGNILLSPLTVRRHVQRTAGTINSQKKDEKKFTKIIGT